VAEDGPDSLRAIPDDALRAIPDDALRAMAENRGCKLVRSRRRKPGGDYGRYGLKDAQTGREVLGFGEGGLTATGEEVEHFLRGGLAATWKQSVAATPAAAKAKPARRRAEEPVEAEAPPPRSRQPEAVAEAVAEPVREPEPEPLVREAKPGDSGAIAALVTALGFASAAAEITRRLAALRKAGEPPLVVEVGAIVGVLTWHVTPALHRPRPVGRVTMMIVEERARGRGLGTALLDAAEARLRAAGCGLVEVTSNIELGGAHAFYRRRGYERTSYRFAKELGASGGG
jgi:ribosomal protein S18 acetylase RimI-like enzyme